jgi:hypothetical protein
MKTDRWIPALVQAENSLNFAQKHLPVFFMQLSKEKLIEIVGELDIKMKCYVHKKTGELVSFPDDLLWDAYDDYKEDWQPNIDQVNKNPQDFIKIERMRSFGAFQVMEEFAEGVKEDWVRNKLINALRGKKPFAHFNAWIHQVQDQHKKAWFVFRQEKMVEWVRDQLEIDSI